MPQLPGRAFRDEGGVLSDGLAPEGLVPNRLPEASDTPLRRLTIPDDLSNGPWRDLGSSARAALTVAVRDLTGVEMAGWPPMPKDPWNHTLRPTGSDGPVVCIDEEHRGWIEWHRPDLIGRVELRASQGAWEHRNATVPAGGTPRLAAVGYDLKFLRPVLSVLEDRGFIRADVDEWPKFRVHDEDATKATIEGADVVLAEWCGPNAVLASQLVRPDQRLVIRLHRFELEQPEWRQVQIDAVDAVMAVSEPYRRRILQVTGWPPDKVTVVPNAIDCHQLDREKLASARFTLGMLGADRSRKRFDRAVDVLERLRTQDPRWQLRVKGTSPWDSKWVADREDEVAWFDRQLRRLDTEPLRSGVVLDPPGPDVASWLRGIGFVLSPSDDESFHLAPAEGMASGAIPLLWPWHGADEIYDPEFIVQNADEAASRAAALAAEPHALEKTAIQARTLIEHRYRLEDVAAHFAEVLLG